MRVYNRFNEPFAVSEVIHNRIATTTTHLKLRHAWLNLWTKHM